MELINQPVAQSGALNRTVAFRGFFIAAVITAAVIAGMLLLTSAQVASPSLTGNHLLDPALVQVRADERSSSSLGASAGSYFNDPSVISLRRGERYRLSRNADGTVPNPTLIEVRPNEQAGP